MVINLLKTVLNPVELITKFLNPLSDEFIFTKLFTTIGNLYGLFDDNNENFIFSDLFKNISSMVSWLNPLSKDFFLKNLFNVLNPLSDDFFLKDLFSWLNPFSENFFVYKLIELLRELFIDVLNFLFVPSEERLTAISNTISSKFDFIDSIKFAINSLKDIIEGTGNVPGITLTLEATEYTDEMTLKVIDFSWYEKYKTYGDVILTGFIYAAFIWRIYIKLSSIIQGSAGVVEDGHIIIKEMKK